MRGLRARRNVARLTDEVPAAVRSEIPAAAARAVEAGATLERLEYVGAGGQGIIFREGPIAYKVARRKGGGHLANEAAALGVLGGLGLGAAVHGYHPDLDVIVRDHIEGHPGTWSEDRRIRPAYDELVRVLLAEGFTAPEYKEDSFIVRDDGIPVLVDAGFVHLTGPRLAADLRARDLEGATEWGRAFDAQLDITHAHGEGSLTDREALELLARIGHPEQRAAGRDIVLGRRRDRGAANPPSQMGLFGQPEAAREGWVARKGLASWVEDLTRPDTEPRYYPIPGAILRHATTGDDPRRITGGLHDLNRNRLILLELQGELDDGESWPHHVPARLAEFIVLEHGNWSGPEDLEAWKRIMLPFLDMKGQRRGIAGARKRYKKWQNSAAAKRGRAAWADRRFSLVPQIVAGPKRPGAWPAETQIPAEALDQVDSMGTKRTFRELGDALWLGHFRLSSNIEELDRLPKRTRIVPLAMGVYMGPLFGQDYQIDPYELRTDAMRPSARAEQYREHKRRSREAAAPGPGEVTARAGESPEAAYSRAQAELLEARAADNPPPAVRARARRRR